MSVSKGRRKKEEGSLGLQCVCVCVCVYFSLAYSVFQFMIVVSSAMFKVFLTQWDRGKGDTFNNIYVRSIAGAY